MPFLRFDPTSRRRSLSNVNSFQDRMNTMFSDYMNSEEKNASAQWAPRVDVSEMEDKFEFEVEMPGMSIDDIQVNIHEDTLSISGEKKSPYQGSDRNVYVGERVYGKFFRSFKIPSKVDASKIDAHYENGLLTVVLPKAEEVKPKRIDIKVN